MVKNVIELLDEISKGNLDKLPKKIMIGNIVLEKDEQYGTYFEKDHGIGLMSFLPGANTLIEHLKFPVKEIKERWKPEKDEKYWCVNPAGEVDSYFWHCDSTDDFIYKIGNCFKTAEEAQNHLDNINTEIELRRLAEELNNGEEIDWNNEHQSKFYLSYDYDEKVIYQKWEDTFKNAKDIYCLDEDFEEKAIEKIGEERLKNYLKEE